MKLVSLNIWDLPVVSTKDRKDRIVRIGGFFDSINADIICLQESFDPDHRIKLNTFFLDRNYITSDEHVASRNVAGREMDTTGGLVTFSRFPILANTFIPFSRSIWAPLEFLGQKGMLITLLKTPHGKLRVINLHLTKSFLRAEAMRMRHAKYIFMHVQSLEFMPTILAGDFNQDNLTHNHEFSELMDKGNFVHPQHTTLDPSYRAENKYVDIWINRITRSKRLDYILCAGLSELGLRVEQYGVVYPQELLSDHDPVVLDLCLA